ncbi:MAG: NADH:flavin oxidoreductase/NADH oxidase family protein, partial [Myxococcota bacterium]
MNLTDPLILPNGQRLPNRLAKSAMSERLAGPDGAPNARHAALYRRWADGGVGLQITGNVMVDPDRLGEPGNVVAPDVAPIAAWSAWATAARAGGAVAWVQLNHPGRQSPRSLDPVPVAPSAIGLAGTYGTFATPRALEDSEIEAIIARFAAAAVLAAEAGFDGVQVHGAHGYLVSQFLSPRSNTRTDRWGGPLDRRMAFLLGIVRAIRAAVAPSFAVGVKLNTADFQRGGFDERDAIEAEGIDLLELSGGTYEQAVMFAESPPAGASTRAREAFFLDQAEAVRVRVKVPLLLTGGFRTRAGMDEALASGAVDLIGLARPLAVEPDLPRRLLSGAAERAVPVKLHTGIRPLDAVLTGAWYQVQLERLADGRPADPALARWPAVWWYARAVWWRGRRRIPATPASTTADPRGAA